jgi:hypothetical protein
MGRREMARNLEDIMRIIASLIGKADDPAATPQEAESFRAKAEQFMRQYRIEEENLIAADQFSIEPVLRKIDVNTYASPFASYHRRLWSSVAYHTGVRYVFRWNSENRGYTAHAVGYESDIRYAEFLFQAARLMMISKLEPEVNPKESDKDNIYRLRSAGIDRQRIAEMVWGHRGHQEGLKVGRLYKEACADRGEDAAVSGRSVNAKTYRTVYAVEFADRFSQRLREARDGADSLGGAITLHGRSERVLEAFYRHFPEERPQPAPPVVETIVEPKRKGRALKAWTVADEERYQRMNYTPAALRAKRAGQAAAESVQIDRSARAQRVDSSPNGSAGSTGGTKELE